METLETPTDVALGDVAPAADALAKALRALTSPELGGDLKELDQLQRAVRALDDIPLDALRDHLTIRAAALTSRVNEAFAARREALHGAAEAAGWRSKRVGDTDRVGLFKLSYTGKKVRVELGSETVMELEEADGTRVFASLKAERETLELAPFEAERFGKRFFIAYRLALQEGQGRDNWIPVRTLYANLALVRHAGDPAFLKTPEARSFTKYPAHQFLFDLARFGDKCQWEVGEHVMRTQAPNMATIKAGGAVTLPNLDSLDAHPVQISAVRFEKVGG